MDVENWLVRVFFCKLIERCHIDPPVAEPAPAAALPAGRQAMAQRQSLFPAVKTDGLAEQQASDHPAQLHQVALVGDGAVLTEKTDQLSMEPGTGVHEGLVWSDDPKLSWLPAHPMG